MTMNQKNTYHLLKKKNKVLCFLVLLLLIYIAITGFYRYRLIQSPVYSKLQGYYKIVVDSTYLHRHSVYIPGEINLKVDGENIRLPMFDCVKSSVKAQDAYDHFEKDFERSDEECNGSWKIISSNPDSIFINAEGHVLHGKYRVLFVTDSVGYVVKLTTDYIIFENDSTHLCLTRMK